MKIPLLILPRSNQRRQLKRLVTHSEGVFRGNTTPHNIPFYGMYMYTGCDNRIFFQR